MLIRILVHQTAVLFVLIPLAITTFAQIMYARIMFEIIVQTQYPLSKTHVLTQIETVVIRSQQEVVIPLEATICQHLQEAVVIQEA